MPINKDYCETKGCNKKADLSYLGAVLCNKCKTQIQNHKFENGPNSLAVAQFKNDYPLEYRTGTTEGINRNEKINDDQ